MSAFTVTITDEEALDLEMILQAFAYSAEADDNMRDAANHLRALFDEASCAAHTEES